DRGSSDHKSGVALAARCARTLANVVGTSCAADSIAPSARQANSGIFPLKPEATGSVVGTASFRRKLRSMRRIQQASSRPVLTHVTGSPHKPCRPNAIAIHAIERPASTHGRNATDHARFGRLIIVTIRPESAKTQAPNTGRAFE